MYAETIKKMYPRITYADLYQVRYGEFVNVDNEIIEMTLINLINYKQLAGVVAVEISGGPSIDFVPGRKVGVRTMN